MVVKNQYDKVMGNGMKFININELYMSQRNLTHKQSWNKSQSQIQNKILSNEEKKRVDLVKNNPSLRAYEGGCLSENNGE